MSKPLCHPSRWLDHPIEDKFNFVSEKSILSHKIQFCEIKFNYVSQKSIRCHKIVTKVNSVSQNSMLCYKIQFCKTKFNSVSQKSILYANQFTEFFGYANKFSQYDFIRRFLIGYNNRWSRRRSFPISIQLHKIENV